MTSLLAPTYALTIGNQRWTQQVLAIDVRLAAAPGVDQLTARLPAAAPLSADPGDPLTLTLDGGEGGKTVFTGVVQAIHRGLRAIEVTAHDALGRLARYRPATTFAQASAGTIIKALASDAGADLGNITDGVMLAFYAADPSRNAAEHAARLAGWSGALLTVDGDGGLTATVLDTGTADLALRYGREIMAFDIVHGADPDTAVVAGESGAGSADSPDALRLAADPFAGNRPDGPSLGTSWSWEPALRTADATAAAGAARQTMLKAHQQTGTLRAFAQPKLRPGVVIELADLPDDLPKGPFWLDRVRHTLTAQGAFTSAHLLGDGGGGASLLSALGL
jgi:prophage tail gpP-like protein